ncbi:uncharacterized protein LOC143288905 [Babylonia areolata]|uniref:uncharacterized protein LOC143288905 n=1 Tax=Babylonia areolata TaxID=304850 RepID=UPI003FCF532D
MCPCDVVTLLVILLSQVCLLPAEGSSLPLWKTQLIHFDKWEGHFVYQNTTHECELVVHSVQEVDGGAYVTFSADNTTLDMTARSEDDISLVFTADVIYQPGDHFYDGFQFVVELLQYGSVHMMEGNITHPHTTSSSIFLRPQGEWLANHTQSSALSIGLAVGVSLTLCVVCVVGGVLFLRWAIRKGYLRHVARSYKLFRSSESAADPPVSFDAAHSDREAGEVNVHI